MTQKLLWRCLVATTFIAAATLVFFANPAPTAAQSWNLVWSDEFNGSSVNTNDWNFETGCGQPNNELECYQAGGANTSVANGMLTITANCCYTSARINTSGKHSWTYGKFEARILIPTGQGTWPAFWMLGQDINTVGWPQSGEIDNMEHVDSNPFNVGTMHWNGGSGHVSYGCNSQNLDMTQFHTYDVVWNSSSITWSVDGNNYCVGNIANNINNTGAFHLPFFLLLNLAIGGDYPGNPNGSVQFPVRMQVDYVRVYQLGSGPAPTATFVPPTPTGGGISTTAWYEVVNQNSGKCVDDANGGTANGNSIQQWTCFAGSNNQEWQFQPTSGGYYKIISKNATGSVWDIAGPSTANGALLHLWQYVSGSNQQWLPVSMGGGYYKFVNQYSGTCLDVPAASTADGVQLQQYTCNGTGAQSFRLAAQ